MRGSAPHEQLDLQRQVGGERSDAHGQPRVAPAVPEDFNEDF